MATGYPASISCVICEQRGLDRKAQAKNLVLHHPDASTWIHYECEGGHTFHRALAGRPPGTLDCNCEAPD